MYRFFSKLQWQIIGAVMITAFALAIIIGGPKITGFATSDDVDENAKSIGYYALNPSFYSDVDYNFEEYRVLEELIRKKGGLLDIVKQKESQGSDLDLAIDAAIASINSRVDHTLNFRAGPCIGDESLSKTTQNVIKERTRQFCVLSNHKLPYYDPVKLLLSNQNVRYKFAIYFPDTIPPIQVKNLVGHDTKFSENSIMISWTKNPESDVASYELYYSQNTISTKSVTEIESDKTIFKRSLSIKDQIILNSFILDQVPTCTLKEGNCQFYYIADGKQTQLEKNKLYYILSTNTYFIQFEVQDGITYEYGINAVDYNKNKRDNSGELQISFTKATSIDDLEPKSVASFPKLLDDFPDKIKLNVQKPTHNIDGKPLIDLKSFGVYTSDSNFDSLSDANLRYTIDIGTICPIIEDNCDIYVPKEALPKTPYYLAIAGVDDNENAHKTEILSVQISS